MTATLRLRLYLFLMDVLAACGAWRSNGLRWRLYGWVVVKASGCIDWGDAPEVANAPF